MVRKIIITGGLGFIGRALVDRFADLGHDVTCADIVEGSCRSDVKFRHLDICDPEAVLEACAGMDSIIHCASLVHTRRNRERDVWTINLDGTNNIIEACRKLSTPRLIYISSASVVYEDKDIENGNETLPYSHISQAPYVDSKIAAEKQVLAFSGRGKTLTCALRPDVVFGAGDNRLIHAIRLGKLSRGVGNRDKLLDFIYISNLADAVAAAEDRLTPGSAVCGQAYFITNGEPTAYFDFVEKLGLEMGCPPINGTVPYWLAYFFATITEAIDTFKGDTLNSENQLSRFSIRYLCTHHYFSITKARRDLQWQPKVSLEEGIRLTAAELSQQRRDYGNSREKKGIRRARMSGWIRATETSGTAPPKIKGGLPWIGHMLSFAANPYKFVTKVATDAGEIASFTLLGQNIVLLTGDQASQLFYRSSDEQVDQAEAYKLMTPIFGEGLAFDAPPAYRKQQFRMIMSALRFEAIHNYSHKIVKEVDDLTADWEEHGEIELVDFMKQLTINTVSHCLLGREFRYEMSREFAGIYYDLEQGISAVAYHFPNLPIAKFRRRDRARKRLYELVGEIIRKRETQTEKPTDLFQSLIGMRYEDGNKLNNHEITGLLLATIFAGHHTSSGTAAWVLIELLKNPHFLRETQNELDSLPGGNGDITFQSMRKVPVLDSVLKEVLRLHPPLTILMRKVLCDLSFKGYTIKAGDMIWACPPVTHRMPGLFANPLVFDPTRFSPGREEDKNLMAYQPFGGGAHKCSGSAFALLQIKVILATLLQRYEFELVDPPETYVDNYSKMIVQPKSPCRVRYRRRLLAQVSVPEQSVAADHQFAACPFHTDIAQPDPAEPRSSVTFRVVVDRQLCQGHAMCMGEAPDTFDVRENGTVDILKTEIGLSDLAHTERAVRLCPNSALKLVAINISNTSSESYK